MQERSRRIQRLSDILRGFLADSVLSTSPDTMFAVALFCFFEVKDVKSTDLGLSLWLMFVDGYPSKRQTGNVATPFKLAQIMNYPSAHKFMDDFFKRPPWRILGLEW